MTSKEFRFVHHTKGDYDYWDVYQGDKLLKADLEWFELTLILDIFNKGGVPYKETVEEGLGKLTVIGKDLL